MRIAIKPQVISRRRPVSNVRSVSMEVLGFTAAP